MNRDEIFRERLSTMLADMRAAVEIPDEMAAIGGLADFVVKQAGAPSWTGFKASISRADYDALLNTFQNQGNRMTQEGNLGQAHAIEVLAVALVAKTQMQQAGIAADAIALDNLIDNALRLYRGIQPASPIIS